MKTEHTPGPWRTFQDVVIGTMSPAFTICSFDLRIRNGDYDSATEADMRLVAAAPDLAAALHTALTWMVTYQSYNNVPAGGPLDRDISMVKSVLAKLNS